MRINAKHIAAAASLALVGVLTLTSCVVRTPTDVSTTKPSTSMVISKEVIDALTVKTVSIDAVCKLDANGLVSYQVGALKGTPDPRKWPDAPSTPFVATDPKLMKGELQKAICEDPLLGASWLVFFATDLRDSLLGSSHVDLLDLNPWLKPYAVKPSEINNLAAEFIPLLDVKDPSKSQVQAAIDKNIAWQKLASYVNTLLNRPVVGLDTLLSVVNYHLSIGGMVVGSLPAVERNPNQESLPALTFSLYEKDQCKVILRFGANTGDKRPELFGAQECVIAAPVAVPPPPTVGCTANCGGTPPCTSCLTIKDPRNDVTPTQGVTPMPNDPPEASPAPLPVSSGNVLQPTHSDPAPANPPGNPAPDPSYAPAPSSPGTVIADPG